MKLKYIFFLYIFVLFSINNPCEASETSSSPKSIKPLINVRNKIYESQKDPSKKVELILEEDLSIGRYDDDHFSFYGIRDIAVDIRGNIYVVELRGRRVKEYDSHGNYIQTFGKPGTQPGEFEMPTKLRIQESTGNLYVVDTSRRIVVFNSTGRFLREVQLDYTARDFIIDNEGFFLGVFWSTKKDNSTHLLCKLDSNGKLVKTYAEFPYKTLSRKMRNGMILTLFTGQEFSLRFTSFNANIFIYGFSKDYNLSIIDKSGQPISHIDQAEPLREFSDSEKRRLKGYDYGPYKPYFYDLFTDDKGRIYVQRNLPDHGEESQQKIVAVFNQEGKFLFNTTLPNGTHLIQNGYIYARYINIETSEEFMKRYKIINWDQLKE